VIVHDFIHDVLATLGVSSKQVASKKRSERAILSPCVNKRCCSFVISFPNEPRYFRLKSWREKPYVFLSFNIWWLFF